MNSLQSVALERFRQRVEEASGAVAPDPAAPDLAAALGFLKASAADLCHLVKKCNDALGDSTEPKAKKQERYRDLWQILVERALEKLMEDLATHPSLILGTSAEKLSRYYRTTVEFESVLFGTKEYYREHMVHSLWVYLLGELLLDWYFYGLGRAGNAGDEGLGGADTGVKKLISERLHAAWCLTALCHDLGYPLEAVGLFETQRAKLFDIMTIPPQFLQTRGRGPLWFGVSAIQSALIDGVIPLASYWVLPNRHPPLAGPNLQKVAELCELVRPPDNAREGDTSRHGFASAYVIYNLVKLDRITELVALRRLLPADFDWVLPDHEISVKHAVGYAVWGSILRAVAMHSSDCRSQGDFADLCSFLVLVDELAECRTARQGNPWEVFDTIWEINVVEISPERLELQFSLDKEFRRFVPSQEQQDEIVSSRLEALTGSISTNGITFHADGSGQFVVKFSRDRASRPPWSLLRSPFIGLEADDE